MASAYGNQQSTPPAPLTPRSFDVKNSYPANQKPDTNSTQQKHPETVWQATFQDPVALYTLWLAVATTILCFYTYRLWRDAAKASAAAATVSSEQAARADKSIVEASRLAAAMIEANSLAKAQARPWLFAKSLPFDKFWKSADDVVGWKFQFRNDGSGPAILQKVVYGCCFAAVIPPLDREDTTPRPASGEGLPNDKPRYMEKRYPPGTVLRSGETSEVFEAFAGRMHALQKDLVVGPMYEERRAIMVQLRGPYLKLWLIADIEYTDTSGEAHRTRLCWRLDLNNNTVNVAGGEQYNEMS